MNEFVESMTCLNALEVQIWNCETSWKKEGQVTRTIVMNEKLVKKIVMNAKIDPKVVMDLSIFSIGGWNIVQPSNPT